MAFTTYPKWPLVFNLNDTCKTCHQKLWPRLSNLSFLTYKEVRGVTMNTALILVYHSCVCSWLCVGGYANLVTFFPVRFHQSQSWVCTHSELLICQTWNDSCQITAVFQKSTRPKALSIKNISGSVYYTMSLDRMSSMIFSFFVVNVNPVQLQEVWSNKKFTITIPDVQWYANRFWEDCHRSQHP